MITIIGIRAAGFLSSAAFILQVEAYLHKITQFILT